MNFFIEKVVPPVVIWGIAYLAIFKSKLSAYFLKTSELDFLLDFKSFFVFAAASLIAMLFVWLLPKIPKIANKNEKESYWLTSRIFEEISSALTNLSVILFFVTLEKKGESEYILITTVGFILGYISFKFSETFISKYRSSPTSSV